MTDAERYADKIAKLLRKAESTTPAEAEALVAKAQELMTLYAIDEELVARAAGATRKERETIVEETIEYTGLFREALRDIGSAVARANDCRVMVSSWPRWETVPDGATKKIKVARLHIVGFEGDVRRVHLMNASLQIQATAAQAAWWKAEDRSWYGRQETWRSRRTFLFGFAQGLYDKLQEARRRGEAEAQKLATARGQGTDSVALVVRDKRAQIGSWMDEHYGASLRAVSRHYTHGSGYGEGRAAGRAADLNDRMGGTARKGLPG